MRFKQVTVRLFKHCLVFFILGSSLKQGLVRTNPAERCSGKQERKKSWGKCSAPTHCRQQPSGIFLLAYMLLESGCTWRGWLQT